MRCAQAEFRLVSIDEERSRTQLRLKNECRVRLETRRCRVGLNDFQVTIDLFDAVFHPEKFRVGEKKDRPKGVDEQNVLSGAKAPVSTRRSVVRQDEQRAVLRR